MTSDQLGSGAKIIIGYVRVSTKHQGEAGTSLERQEEAIRTFAANMRIPVLEIFRDVETGAGASNVESRQGLQNALKACRDHRGLLVVWDWSRLSRHANSTAVLRSLIPSADRIYSVKDGEDLRAASEQARIVHAQSERDAISQRTKEGMARKKAEGAGFGNPGIRSIQSSGTEAASRKAEEIIRAIVNFLRSTSDPESVTRQMVADHLNASGLRTGQGLAWNVSRVTTPLRKARERLSAENGEASTDVARHPNFGLF